MKKCLRKDILRCEFSWILQTRVLIMEQPHVRIAVIALQNLSTLSTTLARSTNQIFSNSNAIVRLDGLVKSAMKVSISMFKQNNRILF